MSQVRRLRCVCIGLLMVLVLAGCNKPEPGHVEDEARRAGRPASSFPAADEDYYHDMDGRHRALRRRGQGPQHVAGVDRRQRPALGRDDRQERGNV